MSFILFAILGALQASPQIRVEPDGPDAWRLTLTAEDETDPLRLAERLRPRAAELCGAAGYHFGRYTFDLEQTVAKGSTEVKNGALTVVQNVVCGPAAPVVEPAAAPVLSEADATALNPRLTALSDSYFTALDQGRYAEAFAMVAETMTGGATLEGWAARARIQRDKIGATNAREIGRLTWYSNPPGAPPGHYGAVDYVAAHALQDECGYLIWYRPTSDAELLLIRQETTLLPHDMDEALRATMRQAHCIIL
ncbi:MAG: DUF4019 domain-containing protein [Candidatus Brevundimonas phytovorans]|nr:DUF4019 domain-containing protein [Brevundimonas sp.]WEK58263.1 MAG: DUF4019 domain-containing protein [Brevundimonas sp.]